MPCSEVLRNNITLTITKGCWAEDKTDVKTEFPQTIPTLTVSLSGKCPKATQTQRQI